MCENSSSRIEELNTYGSNIHVDPKIDEETQEKVKSKIEELRDTFEQVNETAEDLENKEIDVNTEKANEKFETLKTKLGQIIEGVKNMALEKLSINTKDATTAIGGVISGLGSIITRLNTIANKGIIEIGFRETYTRTEVPGGVSLAGGTANKRGRKSHVGTPGGPTLVGEEGREIVVDPETNRWYTVGDHGAEFKNLPRGALVFNAAQTRALLNNGHVSSRAGNAMVSGNAAASKTTEQKRIFVVRKRSNGKYVTISGRTEWCTNWCKSNNAYIVQDFTYSTKESAIEFAHWSNVNYQEQLKREAEAKKKAQEEKKAAAAKKKAEAAAKRRAAQTAKWQSSSTKTGSATTGSVRLKTDIGTPSSGSDSYGGGGYGYDGYGDDMDDAIDPIDELTEAYSRLNDEYEHLIQHQLYYYDVANRAVNYEGMADSLQEQARLYEVKMQIMQEGIDKLLQEGVSDSDERLQQLEEVYWDAHRALYDVYDQINALYVDGLTEKIDKVQSAYSMLNDVADSYAETGAITVDQFQSLLDNGIQFMDYLDKINGKYVVNKEAIEAMVKADKERLAIESAFGYLNRINEAMNDGSLNKIREMANYTQTISDENWFNVSQMLSTLEESGKIPADLMEIIRSNLQKIKDLSGDVVLNMDDIREDAEKITEELQDQEEALDKIVDLTQEMIKSETNDHIKAIEKEVDLFREIVDLKRQSLEETRDEESYQRDVNDKLKEMADLQTRIDKLSLDDSRTAQAERMSLMSELADLQRDLSDLQSEHSYDAQIESLEKMAEDYDESRQAEINALEESISSAEKLYRLAIDRIETRWDDLYDDLIQWNTETGSVLNSEIIDNWDRAYDAAKKYGSYVEAMRGIHAELTANDQTDETLKYRVEDIYGKDVLDKMPESSAEKTGEAIANKVGEALENVIEPYVPEVDSPDFYLAKYHSGGIVGDDGSINSKEALAVLQKGEVVLDKDAQESLFRLIDLKNYLSQKLGHAIKGISTIPRNILSQITEAQQPMALAGAGNAQTLDFRPEINVNITAGGDMSQATAKQFGETVADSAIDKLYNTFERRGISNIFSGKFKQ